jgi:hypothetical protein
MVKAGILMSLDDKKTPHHDTHNVTKVEMSSCIIDSLYNYRKHHSIEESFKDIN